MSYQVEDDGDDTNQLLPFQLDLLDQLLPETSPSSTASSSAQPTSSAPSETEVNALLILARGLGMRAIIANLLKLYDQRNDKGKLVLIVNATEEEEKGLSEEVGMKLRAIGHELAAPARETLYKHGGLLSVTSRILVVDLLSKKLPAEAIAGMVVLHAEGVTPTSLEAFVVRIYRNLNKTGFLKAFSDQPESFTGFSPLQTVLQQLRIRQVIICPRFAATVEKDLKKRRADVIEFYQPLSPSMAEIQTAVLECMEATLSEIKRSNTSLDIEDFTIENALFRSFDSLVRRQLDPVWHKVGQKTKGLVGDLTDLRMLNQYLLTLDCVSFNRFLETMLTWATFNKFGTKRKDHSPWMYTPAADTIFTVARERVYRQVATAKDKEKEKAKAAAAAGTGANKGKGTAATGMDADGIPLDLDDEDYGAEEEAIMREMEEMEAAKTRASQPRRPWWLPAGAEPVLEEQPKWGLLQEVLDEVEQHMYWGPDGGAGPCNDTILVMCASAQTCSSVGEFLSLTSEENGQSPAQAMLTRKLQHYFYWKASLGKIQLSVRNAAKPRPTGSAINTNQSQARPDSRAGSSGAVESAAVKRKAEWNRGGGRGAPAGKRRRVRGGGHVGAAEERTFKGPPGADPAKLEEEATSLAEAMSAERKDGDPIAPDINVDDEDDNFSPIGFEDYFGLLAPEDVVVVRSYSDDDDDKILEELRPKYIVMYDPDPAFVRRIEAYRAAHEGLDVRVYFLMYKDSVEEQRYLSGIRKEKDAFERLIRERGSMVIAHEAEYRPDDEDSAALRTISTRVGGKQVSSDPPRVIVDVREFRSALPSLLHADNFEVVPVTIAIGDYILTPEIAVERKSIPDLIGSFNSGRLYQQCELMTAHYKQPVLLIEFDEKKSFNIENYVENRTNPGERNPSSSDTDLRAKLVLLALSFPKLRILWSSSPYQTVDLFRELKQNRPEPDADRAMLVGSDVAEGGVEAEGDLAAGEAGFSATSQEVLRSLPGVTTKNFRYLMGKCGSLVGLCGMTEGEVQAAVGAEKGKALYEFVHKDLRDGEA